jgi:hypothetical protein
MFADVLCAVGTVSCAFFHVWLHLQDQESVFVIGPAEVLARDCNLTTAMLNCEDDWMFNLGIYFLNNLDKSEYYKNLLTNPGT